MENCNTETFQVTAQPSDLSEGQFLYEIFCPEMAEGLYPFMPPWKALTPEQQTGWQRVAQLFIGAL